MLDYLFYLIAYPLLLISAVFLGRSVAQNSKKKKLQWKPSGLEGGLMGFFALLTSFTLVQTGNYANDRNGMIHEIAADMSEVLRISTTTEPDIHARLRAHFEDFYKIIKQPIERKESSINIRVKRIDSLDDSLDADMHIFYDAHNITRENVSTLLSKIDRMESVYYRLMHSYTKTIPRLILFILVLFSMFIGFLIGFVEKFNDNHIHIISITFVVISFIILNVIHDLGNPAIGFLQPDFKDFAEVMRSFHLAE